MAWSPEQLSNAKVIIQVGRQLGASDRDITIALMAGWQESNLRNLNYGSADSIGIFQQRNPWGSRADRLNPAKSAAMFFQGGHGGQRGLFDFKNRDSFGLGQAAQKVQVSAYPDRYDQWRDESEQLLKELGGSTTHPSIPQRPTSDGKPESILGGLVQPSAPLTALGLESPTSGGIESADKAPQFEQPDFASLLDQSGIPAVSGSGGGGGSGGTFPGGNATGGTEGVRGNYSLPKVLPYVVDAANEIGGRFNIKTIGGYGHRSHATDHDNGKALDFMTRTGNDLAAYAEANWKRLNIKYIIWNQHIWNPSRAREGWRLMEDRGGDTENHKDHVHISFN